MIDITPPVNEDLSRYLYRVQQATSLKSNYDKLKYMEILNIDCNVSDNCSILNVNAVSEFLNAYLNKLNRQTVHGTINSVSRTNYGSLNMCGLPVSECNVERKETFDNARSSKTYTENDPSYMCCKCGCKLKTLCTLSMHEKYCNGDDRPFVCSICNMSFKRRLHLRRHFNVHSKDKIYHCEHCGKLFYRRDYLIKHIRSHEKLKIKMQLFKQGIIPYVLKVQKKLKTTTG